MVFFTYQDPSGIHTEILITLIEVYITVFLTTRLFKNKTKTYPYAGLELMRFCG